MSGLPEHIAYTKVPNFLIEQYMAQLKGSELKVALAICRKICGFQKQLPEWPHIVYLNHYLLLYHCATSISLNKPDIRSIRKAAKLCPCAALSRK